MSEPITATLTEEFQSLSLHHEYLIFKPIGDHEWIEETFDEVPPYLIRVFTPKSAGFTDHSWVKSRDARSGSRWSNVDIFGRQKTVAAAMVNCHLRWWENDSVNLVSWTDSWLFALQYIFYLHKNAKDASSLDDIKICIIDTRLFPKGCFIRDMDLITAFEQHHDSTGKNLRALRQLRRNRSTRHSGSYYFGEYLSQGALNIEDKCHIVSGKEVLEHGLLTIQPAFRTYESWPVMERTPWVEEVLKLREAFYIRSPNTEQPATTDEVEAAVNIAKLFAAPFRLAVASGLIGLLPRQADDATIQRLFISSFTGWSLLSPREIRELRSLDDEKECCASFERMRVYDTLPETRQARAIMKLVNDGFCKAKIRQLAGQWIPLKIALINSETNNGIVNIKKADDHLKRLSTSVKVEDAIYARNMQGTLRHHESAAILSHLDNIIANASLMRNIWK
ncbi:hypothetical protein ED733_000789 [Metarhizium rileyi]|uniref:DUF7587 domain-containing protein n=1 Tax=Metarhizium rileyi (strain RCEF 4871) TaxID=1649241 RepID=A0A5C6G014_METRR|nr:hypothetical protein ED733_000789 [Metarhizium rileyi]